MSRVFFLAVFLFGALFLVVPASVSAAGLVPCGQTSVGGADPDPSTTINEAAPCTVCHVVVGGKGLIDWGLRIMTYIGLAVIVAMAVFYIISAGNEGMMQTAKSGIWAALIGFAIMLSAWLIVSVVLGILTNGTVAGLTRGPGTFEFSCSIQSAAGTASGVSVNAGTLPTNPGPVVPPPAAAGAACTEPTTYRQSLNAGGRACDGTCGTPRCTFTPQVLAAIEGNSGSMDVRLVKSFVCRESSGNPGATNGTGGVTSCGLMQVNYNEVRGNTGCSGPVKNLFDPVVNIQEGTRVFREKMAQNNPTTYSASGITAIQMAGAAYNCCANGDNPNAQSQSCRTADGWPALPKWACPIDPGPGAFNMCKVKDYACDIEECASQY